MVRNLYIRKGLPLSPTLSWAKSTGPGEVHLINAAIKANRGEASKRT